MKKPILILGAGGFAREVYNWIPKDEYEVIGFYQDVKTKATLLKGLPIFYSLDDLEGTYFVAAIGDPSHRTIMVANATYKGLKECPPIIHPTAVISEYAEISDGAIICPYSVISDSVMIGYHVIVNLAVTIGHDSHLSSYVTVSPGANISGNVKIHKRSYIGTGSCIREKITIGSGATVGMGAVVVKDVPMGKTVMGNPARIRE